MSEDFRYQDLATFDPEVHAAIVDELARQRNTLEMIASENFVPRAVLEAQGSVLTNKYAEGYPGKRYYGGCEHVDVVETLAQERAKEVFGAKFANVQPHSGAQANAAVLMALAEPGDTILGLNLAHGGHLTHGMKINFSGRLYNVAAYEVEKDTHLIDMAKLREQAREVKPKVIIAGWSAYPRHEDFAEFRSIADEVGAYLWVDMAHFAGLVAAGLHPSPVPHAHVVSSTVHKTLGGPRSGFILTNDEELNKKINSAVFPGQQGGPLMHVIAATATAFKIAVRRSWPSALPARTRRLPASTLSPAAPTSTSCWWTCVTRRWMASRPRTSCTPQASRSTATRCRSTRARQRSPLACVSARRRLLPVASARRTSARCPTSSPRP